MIDSLKLENIQSHKNTEISFDKGINCIVGSTDKGKSAVIRGLLWAVENRPLGIEKLGSHWIFNDKNKQVLPMSVTVVKNGKKLIRKRTKDSNQYVIGDKELNVVKSDIPEEVSDFFRLSETNIQRQLDSPFLLSNTSGETARYFNNMVNLDIIDRVLSDVESEKRKIKGNIENSKERIETLNDKLNKLFDTEKVSVLLSDYDKVSESISEMNEEEKSLSKDIDFAEKVFSIKCYDCINAETLIDEYIKAVGNINTLDDDISSLDREVNKYERCRISDFDTEKAYALVLEIEDIKREIERKKQEINNLECEISDLESIISSVEEYDREIREKRNELPDTCPVCGKPIDKTDKFCWEE